MSTSVKKITRNKKLDTSKYVNMDTGEELTGELLNTTIKEDTGYVLLSSNDYAIIDSKAVQFLQERLNRSEFGSCMLMTRDLKTPMNIVFNNNIAHSNETLQSMLNISSRSTFTSLIRKLMKLGVLYQIKGLISGKVRVIYIMNPFLARKRKSLDEDVVSIFKDFNN